MSKENIGVLFWIIGGRSNASAFSEQCASTSGECLPQSVKQHASSGREEAGTDRQAIELVDHFGFFANQLEQLFREVVVETAVRPGGEP